MRIWELFEDQAARLLRPEVMEWLDRVYSRDDVNDLYLHGSRNQFETFQQPNLQYGHLIFFSKLSDYSDYRDVPIQAEYYGTNLYLAKIAPAKIFSPYPIPSGQPDPHQQRDALEIMRQALPDTTYEKETKLRFGRVDYQDLYKIVPLAVQHGYQIFRVYECSMCRDSYGVADSSLIELVDRL